MGALIVFYKLKYLKTNIKTPREKYYYNKNRLREVP